MRLRLVHRRRGVAPSSLLALVTACVGGAFWACSDGGPSGPSVRPVASVGVSPAIDTLTSIGLASHFTATARDVDGNTISGKQFSWSSANTRVATVDGAGVATAAANGQTTIRAATDGVVGTASLVVSQVVASIELAASRDTLTALGDTVHLTATAEDARGNPVAVSPFAWATSDSAVASVSGSGVVRALAAGSATITASAQSVSGSRVVTIEQRSAGVVVTPDTATLTALTDTVRLIAEVRDANDQPLRVQPAVTWASSADLVAEVDGTGLATAIGNGSATMTATADGVMGTATLLVQQTAATVDVEAAIDTFTAVGDTSRCTATATDARGHVVAAASFEWSSSDNSVAVVDTDGLVTAVGNGSATIRATADGVTDSAAVVVDQIARQLAFTVNPSTVVTGDTIDPAVKVAIQDANANTVHEATVGVTLSITVGRGTVGATLRGTLTQFPVDGVATFNDLTIDRVGPDFALTAGATGVASATSSGFGVVGVPTVLEFTVEPTDVTAGAAIAPSIKVAIQDTNGNTVPSAEASVALAITSGTGTPGAMLGGTTTRQTVAGVATFDDLTIEKAGIDYGLTATATGLIGATSNAFSVIASGASLLVVVIQPTDVVAGTVITPAVEVAVQDQYGNTVMSAVEAVRIAIVDGSGIAGAVLGGTLTQMPVNGVARFNDLTIDKAPGYYYLRASGSGLSSATTTSFYVRTAPAVQLAYQVQPNSATPGTAIFPAVEVAVQDSLGNTVRGGNLSVTVALTPGSGTLGASLTGTLTRPADTGVAVFSDLSVDSVGKGYSLTATGGGLRGTTSRDFDIRLVAVGLAAGGSASCALTADHLSFCWGAWGAPGFSYRPELVPGGLSLFTLTVGPNRVCGLTIGGDAQCLGSNSSGEMGDGTTTSRHDFSAVSGGIAFASLSTGSGHTCGVSVGGQAYCWGSNLFGVLGDSTTLQRLTPVAVAGNTVFSGIVAGGLHTCGLTPSGQAWCWGNGYSGLLGNGSNETQLVPSLVVGGLTFTSLVLGGDHTCGLTGTGQAYCWGKNTEGQLGLGDNSDFLVYEPRVVTGGLTFVDLAAGYNHTCGITVAGQAYCWGWNMNGQLGDNTNTNRNEPTLVVGGHSYSEVVAGELHTCARTSLGEVYCWGFNSVGQLGTSTEPYSYSLVPLRVVGF